MNLATQDLFAPPDEGRYAEPVNTAGWAEVCKGLYGILAGYLMVAAAVALLAAACVMVILQAAAAHGGQAAGGGIATVLMAAIAAVLIVLAGYAFVVRGHWRCLRNAPEHCHAKWWMFGAILCIVSGPGLSMVSSVSGAVEMSSAQARPDDGPGAPRTFREALAKAKRAGVSPIQIASTVIGMLSGVFFVLFLRACALYFDDAARTRTAELYLVFIGALNAGFFALFFLPESLAANPMVWLLLGGGALVSSVWYLVLIVSTCACIQGKLAALRSPLARAVPTSRFEGL